MKIATLQTRIYDVLKAISKNDYDILWNNQNFPKQDRPFLLVGIDNISSIGQSQISFINNTAKSVSIANMREAQLTLDYFGSNSLEALENIRESIYKDDILSLCTRLKIAIAKFDNVINLTDLVDRNYQERAQVQTYVRYVYDVLDTVQYIEFANFELVGQEGSTSKTINFTL